MRFSLLLLEGGLTMTKTRQPCIKDEGLYSLIPDSPVRMTSFVEAYHRLRDDMEQLQTGFSLEHWQFHAAMAFYFANKELFDTEYERLMQWRREFWAEAAARNGDRNVWAEISGQWPGDETDEEINALLEELS